MPEMPEVETLRKKIADRAEAGKISDVRLHRANLRYPFPDHFEKRLAGATITAVERRAKFLLVRLDTDQIWVTHLGMTGHFILGAEGDGAERSAGPFKFCHFDCKVEGPNGTYRLSYVDQRRFGFMLLVDRAEMTTADWYAELGVEPLSEAFTGDYLSDLCKGRKTDVKSLLTDQKLVAGIGNAYVCEALWSGKIRPDRSAKTISKLEAHHLVAGVKHVLSHAVSVGQATIDTAAETAGSDGYFEIEYKVYDRGGAPCPRKDGGVIEHVSSKGRSTYFWPVCQT